MVCSSSNSVYTRLRVYGAVCIFLYVIGIPTLFFTLLYFNRRLIYEDQNQYIIKDKEDFIKELKTPKKRRLSSWSAITSPRNSATQLERVPEAEPEAPTTEISSVRRMLGFLYDPFKPGAAFIYLWLSSMYYVLCTL